MIQGIHISSVWIQPTSTRVSNSGPEVIKLFSCSTQLSVKIFLLINVKMPTIVGILTFMSGKNSILGLSDPKKSRISWYLYTYEHLKFHAQLSWAWNKFYILGAWASWPSCFQYVKIKVSHSLIAVGQWGLESHRIFGTADERWSPSLSFRCLILP